MLAFIIYYAKNTKEKGCNNMNYNVNITGVGTFHPSKRVDNQYYIDFYNKRGMNIEGLLSHLGRKYRYVQAEGENENTITMGTKAAIKALENANTNAKDIDMIVFVSDTPEYTAPTNALKIKRILGAENANMIYDMNCNCVGMLVALDQISRVMKTNKNIKKALVVGSVLISAVAREDDPINYACFADSGAAIVLEGVEENIQRGFIDSIYRSDTFVENAGVLPACGLSNIYRDDISSEDKKWKTTPFDASFVSDLWVEMIRELVSNYNLSADDIKHYLFSQFSKNDIVETCKKLNISYDEKITFIGEEYCYTGATSPMFALDAAIKNNKIHSGDDVVFCSIGTGYVSTAVYYKF